MILKNNWHIIVVVLSVINTTVLFSQNIAQPEKIVEQLTNEQKTMLKEQQVFIDKSKAEFKNSLTNEQKKILLNKTLSRKDRAQLLKESLTKKQRSLVQVNKNLLRAKQRRFKHSLTKKQMIRLRRFVNDRDIRDRRRLVRRLRRLITDNLNSDN